MVERDNHEVGRRCCKAARVISVVVMVVGAVPLFFSCTLTCSTRQKQQMPDTNGLVQSDVSTTYMHVRTVVSTGHIPCITAGSTYLSCTNSRCIVQQGMKSEGPHPPQVHFHLRTPFFVPIMGFFAFFMQGFNEC